MPTRKHIFVDEAGNFDFSGKPGASSSFILTSVTMDSCDEAETLLELRRTLVWNGYPLIDAFHATSDKQVVRDQVFALIAALPLRIDATVIPKQAVPEPQRTPHSVLNLAWGSHCQRILPSVCAPDDELFVIGASMGTARERKTFELAVRDAVRESGRNVRSTRVAVWPALSDVCLQVADYCCWAIQRAWERNDTRFLELIEPLIASIVEFGIGERSHRCWKMRRCWLFRLSPERGPRPLVASPIPAVKYTYATID